MSGTESEKQERDPKQGEAKPEPSTGPLKNEPTPERAREEKRRMEEEAAQKR